MERGVAKSSCVFLFLFNTFAAGEECGHPGEPANGTLLSSEAMFYPGEQVSYTCNQGFFLSAPEGGGRRACGQDGRWTGDIPVCLENLALGKPATQSDVLWSYKPGLAVDGDPNTCSFTSREESPRWWQVSLNSHPTVASVWVTMSPGAFQKFAIFVVEILDGNTAEYKPCAQFEGRFTEQLAKFNCNNGEGQLGQFVYIRDDRADAEYFGLCEVQVFRRPQCGRPERPVYSSVELVGGTATYSCLQGFTLSSGSRVRNCTHQGWRGAVPLCQEVRCDHPSSTKDGFIEVSNFRGSYVFGSRATYHCNPGFILWGNSSRLCNSSGSWTGRAPTCRPISCGDPPLPPHTSIALLNGSTQWRARAIYSCLPGYSPTKGKGGKEEVESECREDGSWSKVQLSCHGLGEVPLVGHEANVFLVEDALNHPRRAEQTGVSSGTLSIICALAAVILGTALLTAFLLVRKWLFQHLYFPPLPPAEKPLIYDKVEVRPETHSCHYQTTQLSTFGNPSPPSSPSSSALSQAATTSTYASAAVLTNPHFPHYASLPRPARHLGWAYAAPGEVTEGRTALATASPPQYANLPLHYATLGRIPRTRAPLVSQQQQQHSESIPDILQTLSQGVVREASQARVIVNELSGLEEKLVDLSPVQQREAPPQLPNSSYISVKHSNIDDNI